MIFIDVPAGIPVERSSISKFSEVQTRKGLVCSVEDIGDQLLTRENFVLFETKDGRTCKIKISALKNCDVVACMLNSLLQKEWEVDSKSTTPLPIPEVNTLEMAVALKPQPTRACCKEKQERLALIRSSAERVLHS